MPKFFTEQVDDRQGVITGEDAAHIAKVLRMRPGKEITLCDKNANDYIGIIESVTPQEVLVEIKEVHPCEAEPSVRVALFQAMPKGDKLDLIVQKAVELGVTEIYPVMTHFCVAKPDQKSFAKKKERCQRIAYEAAKQSGRGRIPTFGDLLTLEQALEKMKEYDLPILFYEHSTRPLQEVLSASWNSAAILIGSEGGFDPDEVKKAFDSGVQDASLGKRILRCETAPLAALSVLMYQSGNF